MQTCHYLSELIGDSLALQYIFHLDVSGVIDTQNDPHISTAERLRRLLERNQAWRTLEARRIEQVALKPHQMALYPSAYQIKGGYMVVRAFANKFSILKLASGVSQDPTTYEFYEFAALDDIDCIAMDPDNDLLIIGGVMRIEGTE